MQLKISLVFLVVTAVLVTASSAAPVKYDESSFLDLEVVPLSVLHENPVTYDGTLAYRKICVIGTFTEIGIRSTVLTQDSYHLQIDPTQEALFAGFNVGDEVKLNGVFYYKPIDEDVFVPAYAMHYPPEHLGKVEVHEVVGDTNSFNGRFITVIGNLTGIEDTMGRYVAYVADPYTGDELKVIYYGSIVLEIGTTVEVSGLVNAGVLYTEDLAKYHPPVSLKTFIPGFSAIAALAVLGLLAILFKRETHND